MHYTLIRFLCLFLVSGSVLAQSLEHGHEAMQLFDKEGFANAPQWVQIWIGFMMATFIAGLCFVKNQPIARWVVGGLVAGLVFTTIAGKIFGVPNYSGFIALAHVIFWSPALYQLLSKRPFLGERSAFNLWSGIITFVICFSFIFDIRDAAIYLNSLI